MMIVGVELICFTLFLMTECFTEKRVKIKNNILEPAVTNRPFVIEWNVASQKCVQKFGVPLNLSDFDIIHNPDYRWRGSALTIFYHKNLGLYPWIEPNGTLVHGGIPQLVDLKAHLAKAAKDIEEFIPNPNFRGPAVIDWEKWHPLFERDWGEFSLYRGLSVAKVKVQHPKWPKNKIIERAKFEYDTSARNLISQTLALGKLMRPNALWGYYRYPDCYNYDRVSGKGEFDFRCSSKTRYWNDKIQWLFEDSTALFPSTYIGEWLQHNESVIAYVAYRIEEAMRVDHNRQGHISIPTYSYHALAYRRVTKLVELFDLRNSIGVAALLGASGVIIWGDGRVANSKELCVKLSKYISSTLGPFVKATSDAAAQCSDEHCSSHGRCVFSPIPSDSHHRYDSGETYLSVSEALKIVQQFSKTAYNVFRSSGLDYTISCQCYNGWSGEYCRVPGY